MPPAPPRGRFELPAWAPEPPRERIVRAAVEVVAERGMSRASVKLVTARAGVSSRTFYEHFDGLDDCVVAVMEQTLAQVTELALPEFEGQGPWLAGLRAALAVVLAFFDSRPQLARVCLVETLRGEPAVLWARRRVVERFRAEIVARIEPEVEHPSPLAAEALLASVMGLAYEHLSSGSQRPLLELLGPLMGIIAGQFTDQTAAAEEVLRGEQLSRALAAGAASAPERAPAARQAGVERELPAVLANPSARRARECLLFLAEQGRLGRCPSNGEVAAGIGVAHRSQISKLLSELAGAGLASCRSEGAGKRNAWRLTEGGERASLALGGGEPAPREDAGRALCAAQAESST